MKSICVHCKNSFDVDDGSNGLNVECPFCGKEIVLEGVKNCKHCNQEIPASATKCMHCEKSQVSIGIRKPGERIASAEAAPAPVEKPVHSGRKIGVLKPGERSSLPPEPVVMEEIPLKEPSPPAVEAPAPAVAAEPEVPVQKPQKIALNLPGKAAAPAPASESAPEPAPAPAAGNVPKISLKMPGAPAAASAPAAPASAPVSAAGGLKLNLPGKAPGATPAAGGLKLNLPGKTPGAAPAAGGLNLNLPGKAPGAAPAGSAPAPAGGAPKLNLKAPGAAPAVSAPAPTSTPSAAPAINLPKMKPVAPAPAVSAPAPVPKAPNAPKKAVAVQTSVPLPLPVVPKEPEKVEVTQENPEPEKAEKPKIDWGKKIRVAIFILATLIILAVLAGGGYFVYNILTSGADAQLKKGQELFAAGKKAEACAMLERSARQGNAQAAYLLAGYYERGEGVEKNAATALDWYKAAAENGNADAQYMMAQRYEKGEGVDADPVKAREFYKKASEQKHAKASLELARCYEYGIGGNKNIKEGIPLRIAAAESGDPESLYVAAKYRLEGNQTDYNPEQALKDFISAGEKGYTLGYIFAGLYYRGDGNEAKAKELFDLAFKAVTEKKDSPVRSDILAVAWCYGAGLGCPRNTNQAAALLKPLWAKDDAEALYLDYVFFGASSNAKEKQRASEHLKKSADLGYAPAQYSYAKRVGRSAERYLDDAIAQGNVEAYALRAEWELKTNPEKAKELANYAAARNDGDALKIMGDIHLNGLAGVPANKKEALSYYSKGASSHKKAASSAALQTLSKDKEFASEMFKVQEEKAAQGDMEAKKMLAWYYQTGTGVEKNIKRAVELYKETKNYAELVKIFNQNQETADILDFLSKSAEGGNPELQYMLARIYLEGKFVKADPNAALKWYEKAAASGNMEAMYQVGMMKSPLNTAVELYGAMPPAAAAIKKDGKAAAEWFKKAAQKGHLDAQYRYALAVLAGHDPSVKNRAAEAQEWMKKAAMRNHAPALFRGVMLALTQKKNLTPAEKAMAKAALLRAANSNYPPAMFAYGEVLRCSGQMAEANKWYLKAAKMKYVPAIIAAGKVNEYKADILAAARLGYVPAIAEEGNILLAEGKRLPGKQRTAKYAQAQAKYNQAMKMKYLCAGNNLGCILVEQNQRQYTKAMGYFVEARKNGSLRASYNLAYCYFLQGRNFTLSLQSLETVLRGKPDFKVSPVMERNLKMIVAADKKSRELEAEEKNIIKQSRVVRSGRVFIDYPNAKIKGRHNVIKQELDKCRKERRVAMQALNKSFKWMWSADFRDGFFQAPANLKYPWKPAGNPAIIAK